MKNSIYLTAIVGTAFLVIRFIGMFLNLSYNHVFLGLGVGILLLITLPLILIERHLYNKQKELIIKQFQQKRKVTKESESKKEKPLEYPSFRKQQSGLTWGGGNIHGSVGKRGSKKRFLNH